MLSSLPCFNAFCWSAIPTSCYIFNVFYSCSCHFFLAADACLSLRFAIYYRAASLSSQASYVVLAEESQAFFKHSPHTNSISNSALLRNDYISLLGDLCTCVHMKKWCRKGSHSSVSGSNRLMWLQTWKKVMGWHTAQWKMQLFCMKTIVKESQIWISLSEDKERKTFWRSDDFLVRYFPDAF